MNWQYSKLKYIARFAYGDALPSNDDERQGSVQVYGSNGPYAQFSESNTQSPVIIIGRKGSYGKVNWSDKEVFASDTTFYIDSTTTNHCLRWVFYLLQTLHLDVGSNEAAVPGLNRETAYNKSVIVPPFEEQLAIARFLDHETEKIENLLAEFERLLKLVYEKRNAVIHHAVLRNSGRGVRLLDSGVEWIGEIPEHWHLEFARWLFQEVDERSTTGDEELMSVSHITGVTPRSEKNVNMFEAESQEGYKICQSGNLVINTLWAWMGAMGVAFQEGIVSPSYHVYRQYGDYVPRYIDYLVRMPVFAKEVTRFSKGVWSSRLRLYPDEFFKVVLPVPPLEEQREIVEYLDSETAKLDELVDAVQKTIQLLQERRSALITAVVLGKIRVTE